VGLMTAAQQKKRRGDLLKEEFGKFEALLVLG
jgi:hypothetical protein